MRKRTPRVITPAAAAASAAAAALDYAVRR